MDDFKPGDRIRLSRAYEVITPTDPTIDATARQVPVGTAGTFKRYEVLGPSERRIAIVEWDTIHANPPDGTPEQRERRVWDGCLTVEISDEEIDEAIASITGTRPEPKRRRSARRMRTRQALRRDGFDRTGWGVADDDNNYQETWTRDGCELVLTWTNENERIR